MMTSLVPLALTGLLSSCLAYTALEIDNHPCKPENLKHTNRYVCDSKGIPVCMPGWRKPHNPGPVDEQNPCLVPVCDDDGVDCVNGECRGPNYCACEVGWEGRKCDRCVPLPGCVHGSCHKAFECNCDEGWVGAYCDIAVCEGCDNGVCMAPGDCRCNDGWSGPNCTTCATMVGCVFGHCRNNVPHTCECDAPWDGYFCDKPKCTPSCVHGFCDSVQLEDQTTITRCVCDVGYRGDQCQKCRPYWECPNQQDNACTEPNECFCFNSEASPFCNSTLLSKY